METGVIVQASLEGANKILDKMMDTGVVVKANVVAQKGPNGQDKKGRANQILMVSDILAVKEKVLVKKPETGLELFLVEHEAAKAVEKETSVINDVKEDVVSPALPVLVLTPQKQVECVPEKNETCAPFADRQYMRAAYLLLSTVQRSQRVNSTTKVLGKFSPNCSMSVMSLELSN